MTSGMQRVAHRGGSRLAPENTLAAFRNALTLPIDAIELDVQMSSDGQLIVFHDNTVERRWDGQYPGSRFRSPPLAQCRRSLQRRLARTSKDAHPQ